MWNPSKFVQFHMHWQKQIPVHRPTYVVIYLVPVKTDRHGWGLKTLVNIPKGHFVIECVGELVTETEPRKTSVATCWLSTVRESLMLVSSLDATLEQLDSRPRSELYCNCNWWRMTVVTATGKRATSTKFANSTHEPSVSSVLCSF